MDSEIKVFFSNITRVGFEHKNNLYELLDITPAIPIPVKITKNETCTFQPKCDKYYVPKKKTRMKVRTVKDIRNLFEQDNYQFIIEDMEKQQSALLRKIRTGSATDESTKSMAKKLLIADHPISRTAWQMLNNINPDKNASPTQFVLWNGRRIRVVGSRGGKQKFICNHDLGKNNIEKIKKKCNLEKYTKKNIGLLRNSLNIKFKPGPLRRKKNLDVSHQKYHMSPVELVKLPKPVLNIQPTHGIVVEPVMSNFLNKLRAEDGSITEKWAEFAVSVLGTVQDNKITQVDKECCVTFNLSYKCGQDRILMRRDNGKVTVNSENIISSKHTFRNDSDNLIVIQEILDKMLDSVEISLKQDCMYFVEDELPQNIPEPLDQFQIDANNVKERNKNKYGELGRLAVTVIQLPGTPKSNFPELCGKPHCNLGCLCDSLSCTYKFKQHCGFLDCMFGCKCEMSKYKDIELSENDCAELIPGLMKLDNEINASLAKEEQKFHQTVVVSGEKSILLKSRKRTSKSTMKYAEFHNSLRLKNDQNPKKILTIVSNKLNCNDIEPWCMVHNLYKCFCKGRFVETSTFDASKTPTVNSIIENEIPIELGDSENDLKNHDIKDITRPRPRQSRKSNVKIKGISLLKNNYLGDYYNSNDPSLTCARTSGYLGRKYVESYYKITNQKILKMEKHDKMLRNKMITLIKNTSAASSSSEDEASASENNYEKNDSYAKNENCKKLVTDNIPLRLEENNWSRITNIAVPTNEREVAKLDPVEIIKTRKNESEDSEDSEDQDLIYNSKIMPFEISGEAYQPKLLSQEFITPWLAKSYKTYKERLQNGKMILERPRKGSIIIHLWECLLSRYRERKNLFLTTTKIPFRIFIANDIGIPFFRHCINIDTIRFADLHKFPDTVKKLLTNASDEDNFCILGGWDECWEMIGTVQKIKVSTVDQDSSDLDFSNIESSPHDSDVAQENWRIDEDPMIDDPNVESLPKQGFDQMELQINSKERTKWFLMKFENDFTEIYCHKKGFYVERGKILHAINLARITQKTIVLNNNKQTCAETSSMPFGIYALPYTTEYCAVVGPYELEESLGLELVKASLFIKQKITKGYWITTNKVDNMDDLLSYLPSTEVENVIVQNITGKAKNKGDTINVIPSTSQQKEDCLNKTTIEKKIPKIVKPIKICRTNGFYHLTSKNNIVKRISPNTATSATTIVDTKRPKINIQENFVRNDPNCNLTDDFNDQYGTEANNDCAKTGAELIKITSVYSETDGSIGNVISPDMLILKSDEINNKQSLIGYDNEDKNMDVDIEHFLTSNNSMDSAWKNDIQSSDESKDDQKWSDVWIQCPAIDNLGWIRGKKNNKNLLSINFPGFKSNTFYTEKEAFNLINRVLSKHIRIPKDIKIEWKVINTTQANTSLKDAILNVKSLANNYELTENGLIKSTTLKTSYEPQLFEELPNTSLNMGLMDGLEQTSRLLEDETVLLWNETEKRQTEIIQTFSVPEQLKSEMSETLQELMTMNNDLMDD